MEFRLGAQVLLSDGAVAGKVSKVVLEPAKGAPTHIVVDEGERPRPGRLVPVERVATTEEVLLRLAMGRGEFERLPEFDPDDFVPLEYGDWPGVYPVAAQPIVAWGRPYPTEGLPLAPPEPLAELPFITQTAQCRPPGHVVLEPGMRVAAFQGQSIGVVEEVIADPTTGKVTYLVVAGDWGDGGTRLVPSSWIREVDGWDIILVVGQRVIRQLAPYPTGQPQRSPM